MGYKFYAYGDRKLWKEFFTVEQPNGTNKGDYVQIDVTKFPELWEKKLGSTPRRVKSLLEDKRAIKEAKLKADSPVTDGKRTVAQTCIEFLKENATLVPIKRGVMRPTLKPNTISEYDHYFNKYIIPGLGTQRIARLTSLQVFTFYRKVQANGASGATLKHLRKCFQAFLNWAEEKHYIEQNPTGKDSLKLVSRAVQRQMEEKPRENNLSTAQLVEIAELIKTKYKRFEFTTHILAYHGLRIGEALAVRFEDIDLDANKVTVSHQIQNYTAPKLIDVEYETGLRDVTPKTLEGNRVIHLDGRTKALIEAIPLEDRQGYVLKTNTGNAFNRNNFSRDYIYKLKADLVEKGLMDASEKFTAHMYRKFFATLLAHKGVDDMTIKSTMGHKSIGTTQQIYFVDIEDMNQLNFNVSDDLVKEVQTT